MRKGRLVRKIFLWSFAVALVLGIGIVYFPRESEGLSFWGAFYYSIRLFVLEHDLPNFPNNPALIFIYFFSPIVAFTAAGTAISYFLRLPPLFKMRWLSDHVVVCGVGRTGKILAATLQANGVKVVGVDAGRPSAFEEWCMESKVPMIYGDFISKTVLKRARAKRARSIIFASGDDLANVEGVVSAYDWLREDKEKLCLLWAHVADDKLANTARSALKTSGSVGIRIFDTYHIAASKMVAKYFSIDGRQAIQGITLLGFGKFGQDLLEVLLTDAGKGEKWDVLVVDLKDLEKEVKSLAADLNWQNRLTFHQGDIRDLHFSDMQDRAIFLCTDDDIGNLATALMVTSRMNIRHIYVRMAKWPMPAVEEHLSNGTLTFVNINDLVARGIKNLPGVFRQAETTDLKRHQR